MIDDISEGSSRVPPERGHLHFPLRGLASTGAERAVKDALVGMKGILRVEVSSVMAVAEIEFDERIVSAAEVRARLAQAGRQPPKSLPDKEP